MRTWSAYNKGDRSMFSHWHIAGTKGDGRPFSCAIQHDYFDFVKPEMSNLCRISKTIQPRPRIPASCTWVRNLSLLRQMTYVTLANSLCKGRSATAFPCFHEQLSSPRFAAKVRIHVLKCRTPKSTSGVTCYGNTWRGASLAGMYPARTLVAH